ncbi:hypothetical protein GGS24DRAFT_292078 [Hypoxylon argillaceum]|nr:hypothetical protein GGS24DRAFT_292078 [Hypoxylon argillaceum]
MPTTPSALAQLKPFSLGTRSLFVKCVPPPRTFFERRAVLAALHKASQQSIEAFKKLQDDSSFIVITGRPDAATTLVSHSPLERIIVSQSSSHDEAATRSAWNPDSDVSGPIATPANPLPANSAAKPTPASTELGLSQKTFTLHIFRTNRSYDHGEEVRKNPLHGPWPGDGAKETFVSAALKRVIPSSAIAPALRDWETGNQLAHESETFADDGPEGAASMLLGKKRLSARESYVLERIRRRGAERETPKVMSGLFQFVEERKAESARAQSETPQSAAAEESQSQANESSFDMTNTKQPNALLNNSALKNC